MKENSHSILPAELAMWHFLSRTTFGPRPEDVERARLVGVRELLEEQLDPERIDDSAVEQKIASLPTMTMSPAELMEDYPAPKQKIQLEAKPGRMQPPTALDSGGATTPDAPQTPDLMESQGPRRVILELAREQFWRAAYSQRQLQEVMVQFWMNHFNIYAGKGVDRWLLTSFERDTIRPNAMGSFAGLLAATAQSPAMLFYLDNWLSVAPNPAVVNDLPQVRRRRFEFGGDGFGSGAMNANNRRPPFERRGLNENYARELMELHTVGVDGGYTQQDVHEVARCFTGWTIDRPRRGGGFIFRPRLHDDGEKLVLGHKIQAHGGMEDGRIVLQILAEHPATAQFISLQLCRHFITDDPPASVVERTAKTFADSRGEIRPVLNAILTSPEFNSRSAFRAKVKSPFELVASALRTLGAETDGGAPLMGMIMRMGQPLLRYQAPTGYPNRGNSWINTGSLLARMNFSLALASNRIRGTELDWQALKTSDDSQDIWNHLVQRMLGGPVSPETQATVMKSVQQMDGHGGGNPHAFPKTMLIAALLLGSPEFQRK